MNILIHYTLPGGEKVSPSDRKNAVVPSFFISQLLPGLVRLFPESRFAVINDIAPDARETEEPLLKTIEASETILHQLSEDTARTSPDKNVTVVSRNSRSRNLFANWWWKNVKLPAVVKEFRPDAILYVNHAGVIRNKKIASHLKQVVFLEEPESFASKKLPAADPGITTLISGSPYAASKLAADAGLGNNAVIALRRPSMTAYKNINPLHANANEVTDGKNYFLVGGQLNAGLMEVIRAFSVFKKRQKSDWKLVLAGTGIADKKFMASLAHYHYRADLVVLDPVDLSALPGILAGAYALVYSGSQHPRLLPEAFAAGIPVIAPRLPWFESGWPDALLLYEAGSQVAVAEQMMTIYKDEKLRASLVEKGRRLESEWSWNAMAEGIAAALTK